MQTLDFGSLQESRIISLKVNKSGISRLRDARDTIAVGQQGQVLSPLVEPQGCFIFSQFPQKIWGGMENRPAAPPCFLTICRQRCRMFPDAAPATRPPCRTGRRTDAAARCRPSYSRAVSSRSPHRSEIRSASLYSRNTGTAGISVYPFSAPPAAPTLPHGPEKR